MPRKQPAASPRPLYPRSRGRALDPAVFRNPPAEYRGAPFWSWNGKLQEEQLLAQIDRLKQMGFGGFHIHARTGLAEEYLGEAFLSAVRATVRHARRRGMLAWLYDEDRWPSGFAGGLVTRDPAHREKRLLWTLNPPADLPVIARYQVVLRDGRLHRYRRISRAAARPAAGGHTWHACTTTAPPESWFNGQTYVDTFSPAAIEAFLQVTHDRYAATVGEHFGSVIPAIFTDEPHFLKKPTFQRAGESRDLEIPWTPDLPETFRAAYGFDLLDRLPELFWNLPGDAPSRARYCWHDHTAERFAAAYGDTIARRCGRLGLRLTGHMLSEATLFGQTRAVGEVMRGMRSFQLPGIDMLEDKRELTTARQAQSLARQRGRAGVVSELYGVTGWDFDFAGHKRQGDWQAAMGVTVRVPHLAWMTMAGEAKRDYPAAIDYHSPWFRQYPLVEDHFARVNAVLTRGRPAVRVGVIHPIESFWLCFGATEQNAAEMREREQAFADLTAWLTFGLIDFDFIAESLLDPPGGRGGRTFGVGEMRYEVVVVPSLRTIRANTLARLGRFASAGGTVIFAGDVPTLVDAQPSAAPNRLAKRSTRIPITRRAVLDALLPFRDVSVQQRDGAPADALVHQFRIDGRDRHLFIANSDRDRGIHEAQIRIRSRWDVTRRDTFTGRSTAMPAAVEAGHTTLSHTFAAHDHLLLTLSPRRAADRPAAARPARKWVEWARLEEPTHVTLEEPNVLLLDQAQWCLNDGPWQPREEILRLDNLARAAVGLPPRGGRDAQPWTQPADDPPRGTLQLRFDLRCDVAVPAPRLAMEHADRAAFTLDGAPIDARPDGGWWVDESIGTVPLPPLPAGDHVLVVSLPLSRRTNVEWCYLLGDFGVAVAGRHARIAAPPRSLAFGDWTRQGLPFYVGNVTYHCALPPSPPPGPLVLEAAHFRNPLLAVAVDGKPVGRIAFAPYRVEIPRAGGRVDVTAFGHRHNAFGPLHHTNERLTWIGPAAWRSTGASWSYGYHLKPMGVLAAPILYAEQR